VADTWSQAITLMKQVPNTHPKYAVAQAKALEYQTNLAYAQEIGDVSPSVEWVSCIQFETLD
jgi:hypothetical protein